MDGYSQKDTTKEDGLWKENGDIPNELNDAPIYINKTEGIKNSQFYELGLKIEKLVHEFIRKRDIKDWWSFRRTIDDIQSLKEYGISNMTSDCHLYFTIVDK